LVGPYASALGSEPFSQDRPVKHARGLLELAQDIEGERPGIKNHEPSPANSQKE
jgi:hypothetical protein